MGKAPGRYRDDPSQQVANEAGGQPVAQQPALSLIALQQQAGNAAVSRLVAGTRAVQRDPVPGAASAPAGGAGAQDPMAAMTRIAWETGVLQRERDAAAKLQRPGARAADMEAAATQLHEAREASMTIGGQAGSADRSKLLRAQVHANAISAASEMVRVLTQHLTPHDIGDEITGNVIPSGQRAIDDLAGAPATPSGTGAAPSPGASPGAVTLPEVTITP